MSLRLIEERRGRLVASEQCYQKVLPLQKERVLSTRAVALGELCLILSCRIKYNASRC